MAAYLITPLAGNTISDELKRRIENVIPNKNHRYYLDDNNDCFVKYDGISVELRKELNLTGAEQEKGTTNNNVSSSDPIPALIVNVSDGAYTGFGPADLWEWLKINSK